MKDFLDELVESIAIIDDNNDVVFINKALKEQLGFEYENLELEKLNKIIKIQDEEVFLTFKNNYKVKGSCKLKYIKDSYKIAILSWYNDRYGVLQEIENLIDSSDIWFSIKNKNKKHVYANKYVRNFYNLSENDILNKLDTNILSQEYSVMINQYDEDIIFNKRPYSYQLVTDSNGIEQYYEMKKIPLFGDNNEVNNIVTVIKAKNFEKKLDIKIVESLKFLEQKNFEKGKIDIFKNELLQTIDDLLTTYFNASFTDVWIYNKKKSSVKSSYDNSTFLTNPNVMTQYKVNIDEIYDKEAYNTKYLDVYISKNKYKNKSGEDVHYYIVSYPIIYKKEFMGYITVAYEEESEIQVLKRNDINPICETLGIIIKNLQLSIKYNKELIQKQDIENEFVEMIDNSDEIAVKIGSNHMILNVSKGVTNSLGWLKEEMIGKDWTSFVHEEDIKQTMEFNNSFNPLQKKFEFINRYKCKNGCYRWFKWTYRSDTYEFNNRLYSIATAKDITVEKELKEKELLMENYKKLEVLRNEFFANLSHELRTPLTIIMSIIQILSKNTKSENSVMELKNTNDKYLPILKQNGYRLLRIINNLIDATKIDSGFYKINLVNTDIVYITEEIVMSVSEYCSMKGINIIFNTNTEEEIIACDPDQIERIMLNLLSNSVKYTPPGGNIYVDLHKYKDHIDISVEDTGEGISKEKLHTVFDRFIQCEKKDENRVDGSGIGLSLVKSLVEMHDGYITVESEKGMGSKFTFTIPNVKLTNCDVSYERELGYAESRLERCNVEFSDIYDI